MILNAEQLLFRLFLAGDAERLVVTPILSLREQLQPNSLDVRLGTEFALMRRTRFAELDILLESGEEFERQLARYVELVTVPPDGYMVLHPGEFMLGSTLEYLGVPSDLALQLEGKSTWGRVGLQIHATAGFVAPGYAGPLTFELSNIGLVPMRLYPGIPIGQICVHAGEPSPVTYATKERAAYRKPGVLGPGLMKLRTSLTVSKLRATRTDPRCACGYSLMKDWTVCPKCGVRL